MKNTNFMTTLKNFNELARKHKFVYSLFSGTLNSLLLRQHASHPYEVVISLETFTTLLFVEKNIIIPKKNYEGENLLPYIVLNNEKVCLNILIKSSWSKFNYWKLKNINKKIEHNLFSVLNKLYSKDPDLLILLYFDSENSVVKLKKVTNVNPNYYSVLEIEDLNLPYLSCFVKKE
ncbi:hypothetical protein [Mycoplasmopsis canis]|uniref:hypothetical protein n=1 Tax=Mycoplasmopsis canis TaxID=29555 RepID=UPI001F401687|nr:hypothetical protein [Mycoplasmopsis canis]